MTIDRHELLKRHNKTHCSSCGSTFLEAVGRAPVRPKENKGALRLGTTPAKK
jgi:hypothetical protein